MNFPAGFREHYSRITEWDKFESILDKPLRKSIRVNTLKISVPDLMLKLEAEWDLTRIPWIDVGFFIEHKTGIRDDIGNIPEHNQGRFYVQEAASMIPVIALDPKPTEKILDMCASPGSKTTQIAQATENKAQIVACDVREDRIAILKRNLERTGAKATVFQKSGQQWKDAKFDRILVDAPCSGTGTMRTQEEIDRWDPKIPERMSFEQKSLLHSAYCVLKKGGILVYSTCSLEVEENEVVVDWLLKRHKKTELLDIKINELNYSNSILKYGEMTFDAQIKNCLRVMPHDNNTSGFFIAKFLKLR